MAVQIIGGRPMKFKYVKVDGGISGVPRGRGVIFRRILREDLRRDPSIL